MRQARDAKRVSDLATLKSSVSLYLEDTDNPILCPQRGEVYNSIDGSAATNGTGWLPVNFGAISSGSPLSKLPVDPENSSAYYYSYACDPQLKTFELNARMESERYNRNGKNDIVTTDVGG